MQVAFTRQVVSRGTGCADPVAQGALTFIESVLLLFLRQRLTQADAHGERAVVAWTRWWTT